METVIEQTIQGLLVLVVAVVSALICTAVGTLIFPKNKNESFSTYLVRFVAGAATLLGLATLAYLFGGLF